MRVYLLRHAIAVPRQPKRGRGDAERPLTREGRSRMERAARGMKALGIRFDLVLTSPLVRALQTAEIAARVLPPATGVRRYRPLVPGSSTSAAIGGLSAMAPATSVLLVGHEPDLSRLAAHMLVGFGGDVPILLKKGGLCRIDFEGTPRPAAGRLVFMATPKILRRLARPTR